MNESYRTDQEYLQRFEAELNDFAQMVLRWSENPERDMIEPVKLTQACAKKMLEISKADFNDNSEEVEGVPF